MEYEDEGLQNFPRNFPSNKHLSICLTGSQAFAADPHSGGSTGRPGETCLSATAPNTPGNAASSPGSPFHEPGTMGPNDPGGKAGTVYAGNGLKNSGNGQASQYDVACFQQP
jgi:hypothetical protein